MNADFDRYRGLIADWSGFSAALERPLPTCVWTHPRRVAAAQVGQVLGTSAPQPLSWYPGAYRAGPDFAGGRCWQYCAGLYQIQEEVSLYPVALLDPQPGESVLDLCAAPGNKTAQLSFGVGHAGSVVANDVHPHRLRAMRNTIERLGLFNVVTTVMEGRHFPLLSGPFDKILVDAPCSCEGTTRKAPRWKASRAPHPQVQRALLERALRLCRPGGTVVYSTCTYAPEENELVLDDVLRGAPDYEVVPAQLPGFEVAPGITRWQGRDLTPDLERCARIWPHLNDTGGFFVAALRRKGGTAPAVPSPDGGTGDAGSGDLETGDTGPFLATAERFGFPSHWLDEYCSRHGSRRGPYLCSRGTRVPAKPEFETAGLLSLRSQARPPKLTTAACLEFGASANRSVVELQEPQAIDYVCRRPVSLQLDQRAPLEPGYVLVRCLGFPLGMAYLPPGDGRKIESLFPRAWMWG